jgi:hypothetical protein
MRTLPLNVIKQVNSLSHDLAVGCQILVPLMPVIIYVHTQILIHRAKYGIHTVGIRDIYIYEISSMSSTLKGCPPGSLNQGDGTKMARLSAGLCLVIHFTPRNVFLGLCVPLFISLTGKMFWLITNLMQRDPLALSGTGCQLITVTPS